MKNITNYILESILDDDFEDVVSQAADEATKLHREAEKQVEKVRKTFLDDLRKGIKDFEIKIDEPAEYTIKIGGRAPDQTSEYIKVTLSYIGEGDLDNRATFDKFCKTLITMMKNAVKSAPTPRVLRSRSVKSRFHVSDQQIPRLRYDPIAKIGFIYIIYTTILEDDANTVEMYVLTGNSNGVKKTKP